MGRYRVGVNLELQRLDTQGALKRYALHPDSLENRQAMFWLRHKATTTALWGAVSAFPDVARNIGRVAALYLGASAAEQTSANKQVNASEIAKLSDEDRLAVYKRLCAKAGVTIPDTALSKSASDK